MSIRHSRLEEIVRRDPRYPYEAYDFVLAALEYSQKQLNRVSKERGSAELDPRQQDVNAREWLEGVRQLALREFGLMARTVFRLWGINRTDDIGEIVSNLVADNLIGGTGADQRNDFHERFDLDQVLVQDFRIQLDEAEWKA